MNEELLRELNEVLEPFAQICRLWPPGAKPNFHLGSNASLPTIGECKRVAALLDRLNTEARSRET